MPAEDEDFAGLAAVNRELIAKAEAVDSPQRVESVGMEEMRETAPIGAIGCTIDGGQEAEKEILVKRLKA